MMLFFFSSRRRHTRWPRDWSSDVCSSDLFRSARFTRRRFTNGRFLCFGLGFFFCSTLYGRKPSLFASAHRSEERRVGKESRSRWLPEPESKEKAMRNRRG